MLNTGSGRSLFAFTVPTVVLTLHTGDWARVLPSGDPSSSDGKPKFPVPRQGAAALAWNGPLVGSTSLPVTDTIIFGGSDVNGTYLSDVWLLRAYNGAVTSSNQKWSGYGSGSLTTGISADGQGVTVQYLSECATFLGTSTPSSTAATGSTTSGAGSNPSSTGTVPVHHLRRTVLCTTFPWCTNSFLPFQWHWFFQLLPCIA